MNECSFIGGPHHNAFLQFIVLNYSLWFCRYYTEDIIFAYGRAAMEADFFNHAVGW